MEILVYTQEREFLLKETSKEDKQSIRYIQRGSKYCNGYVTVERPSKQQLKALSAKNRTCVTAPWQAVIHCSVLLTSLWIHCVKALQYWAESLILLLFVFFFCQKCNPVAAVVISIRGVQFLSSDAFISSHMRSSAFFF